MANKKTQINKILFLDSKLTVISSIYLDLKSWLMILIIINYRKNHKLIWEKL